MLTKEPVLPSIYFTVTNDLTYDQRMIRICNSLALAGYDITFVGRTKRSSIPLSGEYFKQKRLFCFFEKGKLFYTEYNVRLFIFLLFRKMDGICAIDLDTIIPCLLISKIKKVIRIYDAHELFCEMKEVVSRPVVYKVWKWIERKTLPHFKNAYTVNEQLASIFTRNYGYPYAVIRSISVYQHFTEITREKIVLYQGAVNEGRCFEWLIPAMQKVDATLVICGDGNFMEQAKALVKQYCLNEKILFKGMLLPEELKVYTRTSLIGITLFEKNGQSNYYSLANRFFDYIHAGLPQLCVDFPVYREINNQYNVAELIDEINIDAIAIKINSLLLNEIRWNELHQNALTAATMLNWQEEEKKLLDFYKKIFG
ncbi:MAG: glycosyltransferase [Ferruginibacter sp.]